MRIFLLGLISLLMTLHASEIYSSFSVEANQSANLAFDASGTVEKIHVDVTSVVKQGDPIATLKNDDIKASLRIAKTALEQAEVSLKFAKKDYERQLKVKKIIDEATFDNYLRSYEQAKVAVAQAKASLDYQQSKLDRTTLYAPFDGIIFEKSVEIGDVVSGMMLRTVFKIQSPAARKLILEFDQKYWKQVKVGQPFKYTVDGDTTHYEGVISKIYPIAQSNNRKLKAEVSVNNLLVGLFGDGTIITAENE